MLGISTSALLLQFKTFAVSVVWEREVLCWFAAKKSNFDELRRPEILYKLWNIKSNSQKVIEVDSCGVGEYDTNTNQEIIIGSKNWILFAQCLRNDVFVSILSDKVRMVDVRKIK